MVFRALVVDDDDLSRQVTAAILKRLGASEVTEAADGFAALAIADASIGDIDLVVCDLRMPHLDGIETLGGLAARYPATFVIASAADPRLLRAAGDSAARAGVKNLKIVAKPVTVDKMQAVLDTMTKSYGARWQQWEARTFTPPDCSTRIVTGMVHGEFVPFLQPELDVRSRDIVCADVHMRWLNPSYGLLTSDSFLDVADTTGLLHDLFFSSLTTAVMYSADWRRDGFSADLRMRLPLPILGTRDLPRRLEDLVSGYGLSPEHLTLEVSQDEWLQCENAAREVLVRLAVRGFGLACDDCGIGHATVTLVDRAPFNVIKIAQPFVRAAGDDPTMLSALASCASLARTHNVIVVGKGVETEPQWDAVVAAGFDRVQGLLIAPPVPVAEFTRLLPEHRRAADPAPAPGRDEVHAAL